MILDLESVECASLGGAFLGGGGGGSMEEGKALGRLALQAGNPRLAPLAELADDAAVLTVSAVGAPAAQEIHVEPADYVRAVEMLRSQGISVDGLMTSENGGLATLNGWYQSAVIGVPVVDAACNGRAHPMGTMGSIGLHRVKDYRSVQAAVGGHRQAGRYLELSVSGSLLSAGAVIRQAAVHAGGLVAVARNPVSTRYAREHAAVGAVSQAMHIGKILRGAPSCRDAVEAVFSYLDGGGVIAEGAVAAVELKTVGGFDVGAVRVSAQGEIYRLAFLNEWMSIEKGEVRIATFPDLIVAMDTQSRIPVTTAQVRGGTDVMLLSVPAQNLKLGAGMRDPELYRALEEMTGKEIVRHVRGLFEPAGHFPDCTE